MARPIKHDGGLYKRTGSKIWWMRYRDKAGNRQRESTLTEELGRSAEIPQRAIGASQGQQYTAGAAPRAGSHIWGLGGFLLGEFLQTAVPHYAKKTHEINELRAETPERYVRKHQTRERDRRRHRDVSSSTAQAASAQVKAKNGFVEKRHTEGNDSTSGIASGCGAC